MSSDGGLRPMFRDRLRVGFHWQSIETGGTGLGTPDSNFCGQGFVTPQPVGDELVSAVLVSAEGWIEYKQTAGWACTLRPEQVGWHLKRAMLGGRVFIATRRWHEGGPRLGAAADQLWIHWGGHARELKDSGLQSVEPYCMFDGGPSNWNWDVVRGTILTRGLAAPGS